MAADGVTNHLAELLERVGLGEDRVAERARLVSTLGSVFDHEDDLVAAHGKRVAAGTAGGMTGRLIAQLADGTAMV